MFKRAVIILTTLTHLGFWAAGCSDEEFQASAQQAGAHYGVGDDFSTNLIFNTLNWNGTGAPTTINLSGSYVDGVGQPVNVSITLVVPTNLVNVPIDLSLTTTSLTENTGFTSVAVEGEAVIDALDGDSIQGTFGAVFTDANDETRSVGNGVFNSNPFEFNS